MERCSLPCRKEAFSGDLIGEQPVWSENEIRLDWLESAPTSGRAWCLLRAADTTYEHLPLVPTVCSTSDCLSKLKLFMYNNP